MKKMLMGNEAIALGAIRAGVKVVTGYPGTPSTEVLETVASENSGNIYVEWSVNEKSAMEVAAGAAYAGARAMVTMKQVGLNVASDPLMSLNYVGVKGGMVIVVADDPGPISSQTEQDTRHFGEFAKLMVFDPATPEEAYLMIADAFDFSEKYGRPVIFRPTTRVCHSYATVELLPDLRVKEPEGFSKENGRWVIFPRLSYSNHIKIEDEILQQSREFSRYSFNRLEGRGRVGIACSGVSYSYVKEALGDEKLIEANIDYKLLKISTIPFPNELAMDFLRDIDEVLVIEELDPVLERNLIELCGRAHMTVNIKGKLTGHMQNAGENTNAGVRQAVMDFLAVKAHGIEKNMQDKPRLPLRPPVLCAGCPHRSAFYAVKQASRGKKAVYSGDIGCYTLGNAQPLDMVDTCLCMGAGITIAQGINHVEPDSYNFAFIGDSTFFHTGIPGIINAVYNQSNIIIVVLDNYTTAMTGNQSHPGTGRTATGNAAQKVSIFETCKAIGVNDIERVDVFDLNEAIEAAKRAMEKKGVRVLLYEGPCIAVDKGREPARVAAGECSSCGVCANKLGCPAIHMETRENGKAKAVIDPILCTGCNVCIAVCSFDAIKKGAE